MVYVYMCIDGYAHSERRPEALGARRTCVSAGLRGTAGLRDRTCRCEPVSDNKHIICMISLNATLNTFTH